MAIINLLIAIASPDSNGTKQSPREVKQIPLNLPLGKGERIYVPSFAKRDKGRFCLTIRKLKIKILQENTAY